MKHIALLISIVGCVSVPVSTLDTWKGLPIQELQDHPLWSKMTYSEGVFSKTYGVMDCTRRCYPTGEKITCTYRVTEQNNLIAKIEQLNQDLMCNLSERFQPE